MNLFLVKKKPVQYVGMGAMHVCPIGKKVNMYTWQYS